MKTQKYNIVAVTESWGVDEIKDSELNIEGYVMYRKDRKSETPTKSDGVVSYVTNRLKSVIEGFLEIGYWVGMVYCNH